MFRNDHLGLTVRFLRQETLTQQQNLELRQVTIATIYPVQLPKLGIYCGNFRTSELCDS